MKYISVEGFENEKEKFRATGKARGDAEIIASNLGFKKLFIPTVLGIRYKKYEKPFQFLDYRNNAKKWDKAFKKLERGDTVLIQYPLVNTALHFEKIVEKYREKLNIIVLIHDLDSIRFGKDERKSAAYLRRVNGTDKNILMAANAVISHNEKMTEYLKDLGIDSEKIVNLELFDHLSKEHEFAKAKYGDSIIIAGNLGTEKAPYLKGLKKIDANFRFYGVNFDNTCKGKNIEYMGAFSPKELITNLKGSFGLVWDGSSIETCDGIYGNYLRYNNPHKTSLYLSSGLPVIIWKEAALAGYIEKNRLGITVDSLSELPTILKNLKKSDYEEMKKNVDKIATKLQDGKFLESAIKKVEK